MPARYVPLMPALPVIIEAAINGVTTKERNPNVPRTPEEVSADALACLEAGAAIIHNHIDLFGVSEEEAAERYLEGWRAVLVARPDALLYPTIHFGSSMNYEHLIPLAASGVLRIGLTDPGSVNLGGVGDDDVPRGPFVYANSFDVIARAFEICRDPSARTEPGHLRAWVPTYHPRVVASGAVARRRHDQVVLRRRTWPPGRTIRPSPDRVGA